MIRFVVALPAEAQAVIDYYRLQQRPYNNNGNTGAALFRVYERDDYALVISGIGKTAAAAATAYLYSETGKPDNAIWLNVGIAGHRDMALGDALLAHKITDATAQRSWYPPQVSKHKVPTAELITVEQPVRDYPESSAYDMEASAFVNIANRCSTAEFVQCFKVISDNATSSIDNVTPKQASALLAAQCDTLDGVIQALQHSRATLATPDIVQELQTFIEQWHFTSTQQHQLKRQLQRWHALLPEYSPCDIALFASCTNAKAVLKTMTAKLNSQAIDYQPND